MLAFEYVRDVLEACFGGMYNSGGGVVAATKPSSVAVRIENAGAGNTRKIPEFLAHTCSLMKQR